MPQEPSSPVAPPSEPPRPRLTPASILRLWFGFHERVSQRAYLTTGVALMAVKYAVDASFVYGTTGRFFSPLDYISPILALRTKVVAGDSGDATGQGVLLAMAVFTLPFLWICVSMSVRRAADAGKSPWVGLLVLAPIANWFAMPVLALLPSQARSTWPLPSPPAVSDARLVSALGGVAAGLAIAGAMAGVSIYVVGAYGGALFFATPLTMGAAASFLYNRGHPRDVGESIAVALASVACAGTALLLFALEGVLCLAMAAPIAAAAAVLGALVGRAIANGTRTPGAHVVIAGMLLPLVCGAEAGMDEAPPRAVTTIREIDAPPAVVWKNVVSFSELPPPAQWFFDAGIAYPLRARIEGTGVGAIRRCEFSTGAFVEPITTWDEPRRLAFDVVEQPQPMKEWSPYAFVNAPHLELSFESVRGEFLLVPIDGGRRTRLEGTTWYELRMAPALYWRIWGEALLHAIHGRVLDHVADLSTAAP